MQGWVTLRAIKPAEYPVRAFIGARRNEIEPPGHAEARPPASRDRAANTTEIPGARRVFQGTAASVGSKSWLGIGMSTLVIDAPRGGSHAASVSPSRQPAWLATAGVAEVVRL